MKSIIIVLLAMSISASADLGGIEYWNNTDGLGPYDIDGGADFIDIDSVAFKSQDMKVVFRYPNTIEVKSDYVFDVLEPNQKITVAYIFDKSGRDWRENAEELAKTEITVRGKKMKNKDVTLIDGSDDYKKDTMAIFPIDFGPAGECPVSISYSYTIENSFDYDWGDRMGFVYSFLPAKYWAGGVDRITVDFEVVGGEISELSQIKPNDFKFTENGCRWVWDDLKDSDFYGDPGLMLWIFYGGSATYRDEFHNVIADAGLNVRSGPGTDYDIVGALKYNDSIYMLMEDGEERVSEDGNPWGKCRLLDNTEGYACSNYGGEQLIGDSGYYKAKWYEENPLPDE